MYKKKLPMSSALRPGGEGVVKPKAPPNFLGSMKGPKNTKPGGPTELGEGIKIPKAMRMKRGGRAR